MSIITNFDKFNINEEDKEPNAQPTPTPAPEPLPTLDAVQAEPEQTPSEKPAETTDSTGEPTANSDETATRTEEHIYSFTWYGWVPGYKDFDQEWVEIKAKTDAEAIKKFKESPSAKFTAEAGLDAIDGERPNGASAKFEDQEDGSKVFKSVEVDMEADKFVLKVTKYPTNYFTDPANNKKEITKEEIEPFFGEASTEEKPTQEQPMPEPAKESIVQDIGNLEDLFELACEELRNASIKCRASLTKDDVIVELGRNYPDELGGNVFDILQNCGIGSNQFSVCAESHGHSAQKIVHINGGPQNWSMLNRYGRRY